MQAGVGELIRVAARVLKSAQAASEAAYESIELIWKNRARIPPDPAGARRFVRTVATNHAIDLVRKRDRLREEPYLQGIHEMGDAIGVRITSTETSDERVEVLTRIYHRLAGVTQAVAVLHGPLRLSVHECSRILGIAESTVKRHWARALDGLRSPAQAR